MGAGRAPPGAEGNPCRAWEGADVSRSSPGELRGGRSRLEKIWGREGKLLREEEALLRNKILPWHAWRCRARVPRAACGFVWVLQLPCCVRSFVKLIFSFFFFPFFFSWNKTFQLFLYTPNSPCWLLLLFCPAAEGTRQQVPSAPTPSPVGSGTPGCPRGGCKNQVGGSPGAGGAGTRPFAGTDGPKINQIPPNPPEIPLEEAGAVSHPPTNTASKTCFYLHFKSNHMQKKNVFFSFFFLSSFSLRIV